MNYYGIRRINYMLPFCGQDQCSVDANGRIKFSPRLIADFTAECEGEVVIHCLPEGTIAVYPEATYLEMRQSVTTAAAQAASSLLLRRSMRRFGALSKSETISRQGRITLPPAYRQYAEIMAGSEVIVVGTEIGVEVWNTTRWTEEMEKMNEHFVLKGKQEMSADLQGEEII
jgi:transcriptional regulator MraZ